MGHDSDDDARRRKRRRPIIEIAAILFALALGLYVRAYHYQTGYVPSKSMAPTLQPGDRYLLKKNPYRSRPPRPGDVIVFRHPKESVVLIKRVVAVPGEDVIVAAGRLYRHEGVEWVQGDYGGGPPLIETGRRLTVPEGTVYVMGDNRRLSEDSRDFGPVPFDLIIGRATRILWPLDRAGPIQ